MARPPRLDECLSHRDGLLHVEEVPVTALAAEFGSPLYVVSEDQLRRNVQRFARALSRTAGSEDVTAS
mgnify:CR=1 FL=1